MFISKSLLSCYIHPDIVQNITMKNQVSVTHSIRSYNISTTDKLDKKDSLKAYKHVYQWDILSDMFTRWWFLKHKTSIKSTDLAIFLVWAINITIMLEILNSKMNKVILMSSELLERNINYQGINKYLLY